MIIKLENVFCNPTFCGYRHINIKYVANCVEISDTKGNDICSLGVTKFTVTANEVLFYFVRDGKICQFLSGTISTDTRTFEKGFCKFDEEELLQIANEFNSCP
jgi:methenyltetrahydromethanopterin cyclohydrolase